MVIKSLSIALGIMVVVSMVVSFGMMVFAITIWDFSEWEVWARLTAAGLVLGFVRAVLYQAGDDKNLTVEQQAKNITGL